MWIAIARTGAMLAAFACLLIAVQRSGGFRPAPPAQSTQNDLSLGRVLSLGGSLLSGTLTALLLAQLDVLILGFTRGRTSAAFYGPASQVADNALTMAATVGMFYLPTIATVVTRRDFSQAGDLYRWASRWTLVWVAPVVAVMLACPASVLTLLFRSDYAGMATPLRILAAGVLVNVLFGFNGLTVDSLNKVRIIFGRQLIAFVFNVTACVILIPLLGADGAAIATSSSLLVMNLAGSAFLYWQTKITPNNPKLLAVALGLGASVLLGLGLTDVPMMDALRIALVGAFATVVCFLISYLVSGDAEKRSIKNGISRRYEQITGRPSPTPPIAPTN
jgi:O-antigen/teichoic acid export membrane protein